MSEAGLAVEQSDYGDNEFIEELTSPSCFKVFAITVRSKYMDVNQPAMPWKICITSNVFFAALVVSFKRLTSISINLFFRHARDLSIFSFSGNQLIGQAFYNVNGKIYCEQDYKMLNLSIKYCHFCGKPIKQKASILQMRKLITIIQALERWYHPSCFRCSVCDVELDGVQFSCDQESRIYCVPDYQRKFCPTCAICKKLIIPKKDSEFIRVASIEKDFHVDCFRCEDCGVQLDLNKRLCYPQDQHLLCQKCCGKRTCKSVSPQATPHNSPCNSPNVTPRCLPLGRPHILRGRHFK
ncbi:Wilms tumor protein 1-interacting protein-like protein [Acropora cervicornis]|uniref:Wilms tumor protein 1-interacting protein-like protein n=1 Tax=Acropora cervicornis TaxID=6130 RepID=A0AAD9Q5E7_ACRCE|nr:Wilms tumor protein 1-interacting protein-like protein [Acropora cervicornis]